MPTTTAQEPGWTSASSPSATHPPRRISSARDFYVAEHLDVVRLRYDVTGALVGIVKVSAEAAEAYAALAELAWEQAIDFAAAAATSGLSRLLEAARSTTYPASRP